MVAAVFVSEFPGPLGDLNVPSHVSALHAAGAEAPFRATDDVRTRVREMLRFGGYKPTGRGKPASEYLAGAVEKGTFPSINLAVDLCNAVSLHSGLPITVVCATRAEAPYRIAVARKADSYVFNSGGQIIDVDGLLCLFDANGACGNAVKDSQRTKTAPDTTRTLSVIWGAAHLPYTTNRVADWYKTLSEKAGVRCSDAIVVERQAQ